MIISIVKFIFSDFIEGLIAKWLLHGVYVNDKLNITGINLGI